MKSKTFINSCLLLTTALVWGLAFVAQSTGGEAIGPYSFNSIRTLIGGFALLPVIRLMDHLGYSRKPETKEQKKILIRSGLVCGFVLCIASNLQQLGMNLGTSPGKAGFITACYILFVPLLGIFLGKKCRARVWLGVVMTIIGLYLLCMNESLSLQLSDVLVLLCAFSFAVHIMVIDHYSPLVDGVRLSCIQFFVCSLLTAVPMFFIEMGHSIRGIMDWYPALLCLNPWISILYAGICSCGIGYTFQILGQEDVDPTIASLLLSLESVFAVIAGSILLKQYLTTKEILGCVIIFVAVVLAQLPSRN